MHLKKLLVYSAFFLATYLGVSQSAFAQENNERLITNLLSGKCIDVEGAPGDRNGAKLQLWDCEVSGRNRDNRTPTDQRWVLTNDGFIKNTWSGKCIDVEGAPGDRNGAKLQLWDCETSGRTDNGSITDQKWELTSDGFIKSLSSGKCIDVEGAPGDRNGAKLQLWDCETSGRTDNGSITDQKWSLVDSPTRLLVRVGTGEDDLRYGNTAFISLVLVSGEVLPEQTLSQFYFYRNSRITPRVIFPQFAVGVAQIRSIRIRHDGSPRSGHPFDTYDNWNLNSLQVRLATDDSFRTTSLLYDSALDSRFSSLIARFTGDLRQIDLPIRAIGTEPDFVITEITGSGGLSISVSNIGLGSGRVTEFNCWSSGRATRRATDITLNVGATATVPIASLPPSGTVTCAVVGVDARGNPEAVTLNNKFSRIF